MSLSFPSRIGDQVSASPEAQENVAKLLQADLRGRKDQVVTRVALEYFQRIKQLHPGRFEGMKSWVKAGAVYAVSGALTVAALGGAGWGLFQVSNGYRMELGMTLLSAGWLSSELGFKPVNAASALLILTVRDSANRAAKWSVKQDERSLEAKEAEAKTCHQEILNQLAAVYNDCAKNLHEHVELVEKSRNANERVQLKQMADHLGEKLPVVEKLLKQFDLGRHEVESVLQRLKDGIRNARVQSCKLLPQKSYAKMNAELIAGWPRDSIREIAVPLAIKERIAAARQSRLGLVERCKGYGSSVLGGVTTLTVSTVAIAILAAGYDAYQNGIASTFDKVRRLIASRTMPAVDTNIMLGLGGAASLGVVGSAATMTKRISTHQKAIIANAEYVSEELEHCADDLRTIYDGVKSHFETLRGSDRMSMSNALKLRLPAIKAEIQNLGLENDSIEILGSLEQALR